MIELRGNYFLKVDLGGNLLNIDVQNLKEFVIVQDINKLLPEVRVVLVDPQGILTHLMPQDRGMSEMSVQIGKSIEHRTDEEYNDFDFMVFRRSPEGQYGPSAYYEIKGLLNMEVAFAPDKSRAWRKSIKNLLSDLAINELGCDKVEISPSLDYTQLVVQPGIPLLNLFNDLKKRLIGKNGEGAFKIFVKKYRGKSVFVCKSLEELYRSKVRYQFIINDVPIEDHLPVYDYQIIDNYKLFGIFGSKKQTYNYFDYENSKFKKGEVSSDSFYSLADYFLIDKNDSTNSISLQNLGRTNEFTSNFENVIKANFYSRLNSLVKMWIYTWGIPNIQPGEVVKVLFAHGVQEGNLQTFQYSGFWLVERVVHMFGNTHSMRLLLTRNGVDTDLIENVTLVKATRKKTQK